MAFKAALAVVALAIVAGCGPGATTKIEKTVAAGVKTPDSPPPRLAFDGCRWEKVSGAGLSLWSQVCERQRLVADDAAGVLWVEAVFEGKTDRGEAIRVFTAPDGGLEGLAKLLMQQGGAPAGATCALESAPDVVDKPAGVIRYALNPIGATKTAWDKANAGEMKEESTPCGRYGLATTGDRYVEIQDGHPDKAIFVELGSEVQIFEPSTIAFAAASDKHNSGKKDGEH